MSSLRRCLVLGSLLALACRATPGETSAAGGMGATAGGGANGVGTGGAAAGASGGGGTAGATGGAGGSGGAAPTPLPVLGLGPFSACVVNVDQSVKCAGKCGTTGNGGSRDSAPPGLKASSVAVGRDFACALLAAPVAGSLVTCFGNVAAWQVPALTDVVEVVAGDQHACARSSAGTVTCWGDMAHAAPGDLTAKQLAASGAMTCAIASDDSVRCWGPRPALPPPDLKALQIAVSSQLADALQGPRYGCAVTTTNAVRCWGDDPGHVQTAPSDVQARKVAVGRSNACAIALDGSVKCWGTEPRGAATMPVGLTPAALFMSFRSAAAVGLDGKLSVWGDANDEGSLL